MKITPRIYLGTMTFGWSSQTSSVVDQGVANSMVSKFYKSIIDDDDNAGIYVDTARIYAGGKTEPMVGLSLKKLGPKKSALVKVGTKAHPSQPHGLTATGIRSQLQASLDAMKINKIQEYYLHQPDTEHSLEDSLKCMHDLVEEGTIELIGLSNYHASEVERAFELCESNNWHKPSVYQGLYNPLNRMVEDELLPLLHKHNCSFVAYNPLAAGLLTGKYSCHNDNNDVADDVPKGRFKNNKNYLPRFYTSSNFRAVKCIREACDKSGISMVDATFHWLLSHSALTPNDGILLGASSIHQLESNIAACRPTMNISSPLHLPDEVKAALDNAWSIVLQDGDQEPFSYWRSYSSDMPNRENLHQGASYSAAAKKK